MMKHSWVLIPFVAAFFGSCKDLGSNVNPTVVTPAITSIQPDSAAVGDTVMISGSNFGDAQGSASVLFSPGIAATVVVSWNSSSIVVKVPAGAVTGNVTVSVNGTSSNGIGFKTSTAASSGVSFQTDVLPILLNNCAVSGCHTGSSPIAGFNPSTYAGLRAGGVSYHQSVVIPFDSTGSGLMAMIRGTNNLYNLRMPQKGQYFATGLPDSMIVTIGTWIQQGAIDN